jgi:hypothetical protein
VTQSADQMLLTGDVPRLCQNGRETAVISGPPRAPRTTTDLGTRRLTPCPKRPTKQPVLQHSTDVIARSSLSREMESSLILVDMG